MLVMRHRTWCSEVFPGWTWDIGNVFRVLVTPFEPSMREKAEKGKKPEKGGRQSKGKGSLSSSQGRFVRRRSEAPVPTMSCRTPKGFLSSHQSGIIQ